MHWTTLNFWFLEFPTLESSINEQRIRQYDTPPRTSFYFTYKSHCFYKYTYIHTLDSEQCAKTHRLYRPNRILITDPTHDTENDAQVCFNQVYMRECKHMSDGTRSVICDMCKHRLNECSDTSRTCSLMIWLNDRHLKHVRKSTSYLLMIYIYFYIVKFTVEAGMVPGTIFHNGPSEIFS